MNASQVIHKSERHIQSHGQQTFIRGAEKTLKERTFAAKPGGGNIDDGNTGLQDKPQSESRNSSR